MKLVADIVDIPELNKPNIHIRNKPDLIRKINKIISDGHNKLQIVTDFDHTLTRHEMDDGNTVLTSFGMFRECPSIPQDYKDEDNRLSEIYKPIEVDSKMDIDEKIKHMVDWYISARKLLNGMKFPRRELEDISKQMVDCFRIGVSDLISWSEAHKVPVLVFSAGLGDSVVAALSSANFLLPHVKVVSNFLSIDLDDTVTGIKGDVIHTYNKNETAIKNTEYYDLVKERSNVLLLGDNIGDAGMAEGMDCDVIVKIGFLGRNVEANLRSYTDMFDIVLVSDHTMDVANAILQLL